MHNNLHLLIRSSRSILPQPPPPWKPRICSSCPGVCSLCPGVWLFLTQAHLGRPRLWWFRCGTQKRSWISKYFNKSSYISAETAWYPLKKWSVCVCVCVCVHVCVHARVLSCIWLMATLWTVAPRAPPPMGFPRQEYWSRLPFPPPGDLSNPRTEPESLALQVDSLTAKPLEKQSFYYLCLRWCLILSSSSSFERVSAMFSEPLMSQHPAHHSSQCVLNKSLNWWMDWWKGPQSRGDPGHPLAVFSKNFSNHYGASQNIKIFCIFLVSAQPLAG